jgi:hypothetical protein
MARPVMPRCAGLMLLVTALLIGVIPRLGSWPVALDVREEAKPICIADSIGSGTFIGRPSRGRARRALQARQARGTRSAPTPADSAQSAEPR